ncbi:MAG: Spy/CpxP family protein refolding chaperone [Proteobacteria bacterium]|nr:Spy/CpxP family protein refolding chaperone [Pseudomonadota bacterium]
MNAFLKQMTMAGVIAGASIAAIAQTPPPPPPPAAPAQVQPRDPAQWRAKMAERHAKRMERLKTELKITPQQQGAWNRFAEALQPPAPPEHASREKMREQFARMTTPERIDRMRALRDRRAALMDQREIATKTFYAALSPEQQKKFDDITLRMMQRHGERGGHRGPKG